MVLCFKDGDQADPLDNFGLPSGNLFEDNFSNLTQIPMNGNCFL